MPRYPIKRSVKTTTVYHVGDKPEVGGKVDRDFSQEGGEVSVSRHPEEWMHIAKLGGGKVWALKKSGARFFQVPGNSHPKATAWAVEHDYLKRSPVWHVNYFDLGVDDEEEEVYMEFDTSEEAERELTASDDGRSYVTEDVGFKFGPAGEAYWRACFDDEPRNVWAEAFAPIFYARAHGYDGVWYNETYDPENLSCPRGLILQEKLPEWTVTLASDYPSYFE